MQVGLPVLLRISNPLFQYLFCFLNELAMQINRIISYSPWGIVLSEDKIGCLLVVLIHLRCVSLAFL